MLSETRKKQLRDNWEKHAAKIREAGMVRKTLTIKANDLILIVNKNDNNQNNTRFLEQKEAIKLIIEQLKENNEGNIALATQTNLVTAIQQIEEII